MEKLFELKKDIDTPDRYIRAGEQKTKKEWEKLFPAAFSMSLNDEWFIDLSNVNEDEAKTDLAYDVVNELFEEQGLKSITYKEVAVRCIKEYVKLTTKNQNIMKKIKATFKGANGSEGFITGKEYMLALHKHENGAIHIEDPAEMNRCEYESFIAFLNNWDYIQSI